MGPLLRRGSHYVTGLISQPTAAGARSDRTRSVSRVIRWRPKEPDLSAPLARQSCSSDRLRPWRRSFKRTSVAFLLSGPVTRNHGNAEVLGTFNERKEGHA